MILIKTETLELAKRAELNQLGWNGLPLTRAEGEWVVPDGYKYVADLPRPTETPEGYRWQRSLTLDNYGWEAVELPVVEPIVQPVTKLTIKRRLDVLGKWELFKTILDQTPAIKDEWDIAQDIRADDPMFVSNAESLKLALGITDEEFDALLAPLFNSV